MGAAASKSRVLPKSSVGSAVKQMKPGSQAPVPSGQPKDEDFLSKAISLGIVQVESKPQIINKTHKSVTNLENRRKLEEEHDALIGKVKANQNLRSFGKETETAEKPSQAPIPRSTLQKYVNTEQLTSMLQDAEDLKVGDFSKKYNLEPGFVRTNLIPIFNRRIRLPTLRAELPDDWETHQTNFSVRRIRKGEYNLENNQQSFQTKGNPLLSTIDQEADSTDMSQTLDTTLMNMLDNGERVDHFKGHGINGPVKSDEFKRGKRLQSQIKEVKRVI
ncbi:unnamed protein product [Kuraishia capsulata CBS 1993]|uniref:Uncharacterized protein n=1 Tax=Kuraishia capsulata CBS 1993 TaxID=1382522 RepID=W6MWG8_9ASCO|nr:uncharacterized protein KUCA_T00003398001 [Kuraishia capsulata CBS 1993]CDK27420.1 unnamed protein product [Kuraishia capsulata CBS 1993]